MFFSRACSMISVDVPLHLVDRQSAEPVVAAERDDEDLDVPFERPVEPPHAAGGRVAGHARIDHLELVSLVDRVFCCSRDG